MFDISGRLGRLRPMLASHGHTPYFGSTNRATHSKNASEGARNNKSFTDKLGHQFSPHRFGLNSNDSIYKAWARAIMAQGGPFGNLDVNA